MARMPAGRPSRPLGAELKSARLGYGVLRRRVSALVVIGSATLLFLFVLQISVAGALRAKAPQIALAWSAIDADARANVAARILTMDRASPASRARAAALARDAIERDITRVTGLRSLALASTEPGRQARETIRLMTLAERMSRRDQPTQLWLADEAGRRRDVVGLIRHFDIALRTTSRSRETLLAALVAASRDPMIAAAVERTLSDRPNWWLHFISVAIETGTPEQAYLFSRGQLNSSITQERAMIRSAIERLVNATAYDSAFQLYVRALGNADAEALRNPLRNGGFEVMPDFPPFDWAFEISGEQQAAREPRADGRGNVLRLTAENDVRGDAAVQLLHLAPGNYQFRVEVGNVPADYDDRPRFVVRCATGGAVLRSLAPTSSGGGPFVLRGRFEVPANCRWQWLAVQVSGGGSQADSGAWIDNVTIMRL